MPTEIADDATHEEITELVDQLVEDQKEETPPEGKGDAQKIAEERDEPVTDTSAETESGSEDTADDGEDTADDGEETGDSEDQADWLDDDLKAEVAAYGIDEKELADFTSREELERALRFFDKSALEAGRKAMAEGETQTRDEKSKFATKEPESKKESTEGKFEISLNRDEKGNLIDEDIAPYDKDLVGEFTRMRDHYESRVDALESRFAEVDAKAEEQQFDGLVDSLGHADLFGKGGKENSKQLQRRQDLFVAVKAQQLGLQQLGRGVDLDASLVNRVTRMVFAEELGKKDLKSRTRKVSKQSNGRGGDSATKGTSPVESLLEETRRHYKELEDAG